MDAREEERREEEEREANKVKRAYVLKAKTGMGEEEKRRRG